MALGGMTLILHFVLFPPSPLPNAWPLSSPTLTHTHIKAQICLCGTMSAHKSQSLNTAEGNAEIKSLQAANWCMEAQCNILK